MKLDILVIASHPDDAELGGGGTIACHTAEGKQVGILDLTKGEMGTRGTPGQRLQEAQDAADVLGVAVRENLGLPDAFFDPHNEDQQLAIIRVIRKYQPDIVLANAITDRHPDHGKGAEITRQACFKSGLRKITTAIDGQAQDAWRPKAVYYFVQNNFIDPDFVVDVSEVWETKMDAVKAFKSQFHNPNSQEPETFISSSQFMEFLHARGREFGHAIGAMYGEGFTVNQQIGIKNLFDLQSTS